MSEGPRAAIPLTLNPLLSPMLLGINGSSQTNQVIPTMILFFARPQLLVVTADDKYGAAKRELCAQVCCYLRFSLEGGGAKSGTEYLTERPHRALRIGALVNLCGRAYAC